MKRWIVCAAAAAALALPAPALGFHHVAVPANECGQSPYAGGANPTATAAIRAHNPAQGQSLPLPPAGTPSHAAEAPAVERCGA